MLCITERNGNAKIILTDLSIKLTRLIHKNQMNNVASIFTFSAISNLVTINYFIERQSTVDERSLC
jgi:hypothetical protein